MSESGNMVTIAVTKGQLGLAPNQNAVARSAYQALCEMARSRWGYTAGQAKNLEFGYLIDRGPENEAIGLKFFAARKSPPPP